MAHKAPRGGGRHLAWHPRLRRLRAQGQDPRGRGRHAIRTRRGAGRRGDRLHGQRRYRRSSRRPLRLHRRLRHRRPGHGPPAAPPRRQLHQHRLHHRGRNRHGGRVARLRLRQAASGRGLRPRHAHRHPRAAPHRRRRHDLHPRPDQPPHLPRHHLRGILEFRHPRLHHPPRVRPPAARQEGHAVAHPLPRAPAEGLRRHPRHGLGRECPPRRHPHHPHAARRPEPGLRRRRRRRHGRQGQLPHPRDRHQGAPEAPRRDKQHPRSLPRA